MSRTTPRPKSTPAPHPTTTRSRRWLAPTLLGALTASLALAWLAHLMGVAAHARLNTDECYHAYVAEWIVAHHRLPVVLPELYSGFAYYYPPLLHLLGALWVTLAGVGSIVQLNVLLFAALLSALAWLPVPGLAATPRRWAVLLCLANGWLVSYATRLYAEMLISTLVAAAALLAWRAHRTGRMRDAVVLGVVSGLAMTAKHTALVLPVAFLVMMALAITRRDAAAARRHLASLAVAMAIALPYFIRNQVLWGSPLYPAFARDTHALVWRLNLAKFSLPALAFYRGSLVSIGAAVLVMSGLAFAIAAWRRRASVPLTLMLGGLVVLMLGALAPLHDVRHATPLIAVLAIAASAIVADAVGRRSWLAWTIEAALVVVALLAMTRPVDLREDIDLPPELEQAYTAIRQVAPADATILSLWTYDTFYYTRRPATWPIPWAQRSHPVELFYEKDPERFLGWMRHYHITLMLVPRTRPREAFDGANYPASLVDCVVTLLGRNELRVLWRSDRLALVTRTDTAR